MRRSARSEPGALKTGISISIATQLSGTTVSSSCGVPAPQEGRRQHSGRLTMGRWRTQVAIRCRLLRTKRSR